MLYEIEDWLLSLLASSVYHRPIHFSSLHYYRPHSSAYDGKTFSHEARILKRIQRLSFGFKKNRSNQHPGWILQPITLLLMTFAILCGFFNAYFLSSKQLKNGVTLSAMMVSEKPSYPQRNLYMPYVIPLLKHLNAIRHYQKERPWYVRLGFSNNSGQVELLEALAIRSIRDQIILHVIESIQDDLTQTHNQWEYLSTKERNNLRGKYYVRLKLLLMLFFPHTADMDFAKNELARVMSQWMKGLQSDKALSLLGALEIAEVYLGSSQLKLKAMAGQLARPSSGLIKQAREDLRLQENVENKYWEMAYLNDRLAGLSDVELPPFILFDSMHLPSSFFLKDTYRKKVMPHFHALSKFDLNQDWVIKAPLTSLRGPQFLSKPKIATKQQRQHNDVVLNTLYLSGFFEHWLNWFNTAEIKSFYGLQEGANHLAQWFEKEGGMVDLVKFLHEQFSIIETLPKSIQNKLPLGIKSSLEDLKNLTYPHTIQKDLMLPYLEQMQRLQAELESLVYHPGGTQVIYESVADLFRGKGQETQLFKTLVKANQLSQVIEPPSLRAAYKRFLLAPYRAVLELLLKTTSDHLSNQWDKEVVAYFKANLSPYFPFNSNGADLNLGVFEKFLSPNGGVINTYLKALQPFVLRSVNHYERALWQGQTLPLESDFLKSLNQWVCLSNTFFEAGDFRLNLSFKVSVLPTPGIQQTKFSIYGKNYVFENGPPEWTTFQWPGKAEVEAFASIQATSKEDKNFSKIYSGDWGLFRLMEQAKGVGVSQDGIVYWLLQAPGGQKKIKIKLRFPKACSPFNILTQKIINKKK